MYIYIRGVARSRDVVYDKIADAADQIDEHLVRLMLYPDSEYVDHWVQEIWAFLHRVHRLKGSNKFPKAQFIEDALSCGNDIIPNIIQSVKDMESDLSPTDIQEIDVYNVFTQYKSWLASKLSMDGIVSKSEVQAKLRELIGISL